MCTLTHYRAWQALNFRLTAMPLDLTPTVFDPDLVRRLQLITHYFEFRLSLPYAPRLAAAIIPKPERPVLGLGW